MRNRIRYLLVLLCAAVFFLCFNGYLSLYVLVVFLLFPLISFLLSLPGMLSIRLELALGAGSARKGKEIPLRIQIRSRFPLASGRAGATLTVRNTLTGESQKERLTFTACRGDQAIGHKLVSPTCGQVVCTLSKGWAWDYLGLFAIPLRLPKAQAVLFYPAPCRTSLLLEPVSMPGGEGERYSQTRPGDDPSELFGLREYRDGDRLSRVHWKLSEKAQQTLVKELSQPVTDHIFFLAELNGPGKAIDALLDAFATLSAFLAEREAGHRVGFWDGVENQFRILEVSGSEDALPALQLLLTAGRMGDLPSLEGHFLPAGVSHALYLSCSPSQTVVDSLRAWMPGARLSVVQAAESEEPARLQLPGDGDFTLLQPGRVAETLNGFRL